MTPGSLSKAACIAGATILLQPALAVGFVCRDDQGKEAVIEGETTARHLERLITIIGEALAVADDGDQPMIGAHLHSCLKNATALRSNLGKQ